MMMTIMTSMASGKWCYFNFLISIFKFGFGLQKETEETEKAFQKLVQKVQTNKVYVSRW